MKNPLTLLASCVFTTSCFASSLIFTDSIAIQDQIKQDEKTILQERGLTPSDNGGDINPPYVAGYIAIEVMNDTGLNDNQVYILIKGQDVNDDQCFLDLSNPLGSYAFVTTSSLSQNYSYPLSSLPGITGKRYFYIPQPFISGRMYFSINYPLILAIVPGGGVLTITDPSAFDLHDPNYYTLYDKCELTFTTSNPNVDYYTNPTAVDFFSLPIQLHMNNSVGSLTTSGFNQSRSALFSGVESVFSTYDKTSSNVWNKLLLPFWADPNVVNKTLITYLRVSAPAPASADGAHIINPDQAFPQNYLTSLPDWGFNYVDNVWDFYKVNGQQLVIDCSEIATTFGPGPSMPAYYYFTGTVDAVSDVFTFDNLLPSPNNYVWSINTKPTSCYPFFAGAGFDDDGEANGTPGAIIVRQLTSAFDVGLLPTSFPTNSGFAFMNYGFFQSEKANYYTPNSEWGSDGANNGPFYDLYSKALHSFGNPIYTFAYDDALGQDGTLTGDAETLQSSVTITLGPVDTPIPDPFEDNTLWDVTFSFSTLNPVSYRQGTSGPFITPTQGQTITGVTSNANSPFQIQLANSPDILTVYFKYNIVIPGSSSFTGQPGTTIDHTGATTVTLTTGA